MGKGGKGMQLRELRKWSDFFYFAKSRAWWRVPIFQLLFGGVCLQKDSNLWQGSCNKYQVSKPQLVDGCTMGHAYHILTGWWEDVWFWFVQVSGGSSLTSVLVWSRRWGGNQFHPPMNAGSWCITLEKRLSRWASGRNGIGFAMGESVERDTKCSFGNHTPL